MNAVKLRSVDEIVKTGPAHMVTDQAKVAAVCVDEVSRMCDALREVRVLDLVMLIDPRLPDDLKSALKERRARWRKAQR